jgi:nucleoside-diphosphate-sugar epimerase
MRILITGGAGCLGSNLVEKYHGEGHEICVVDNFATGKREVLSAQNRLQIIEGSVADGKLIQEVFESFQPTHLIHSAAAYKDPDDWNEDTTTNVLGTVNLAKACLKYGIAKVVNFQTALCYGIPEQIPIPIDHQTRPFTSYGISKTAGESYLLNSGLPVVSLRLANICGPRLAIGPIPTFYKRLQEGKDCFCTDSVRDFLDMSDFLSLMDIVLRNDSEGGVFNVSTGKGYTIHEVFSEVARYLKVEVPEVPIVPVTDDDIPKVVLDPKKTQEVFGWSAMMSFENMIHKQLDWYDKYGVTDIFSHLSTNSQKT